MSKKLIKSTAVVSALTMVSRVLGLARDIVFARFIGLSTGPGMDAFLVAFKIPNFMRRLFAEGAFSQAFVPVFAECKTREGHEQVRDLSRDVAGTLGGVLLLVTVVGVLAAPVLISIFAFGWLDPDKQDKFDLAVDLLRVTFPYLMFISLTALAGGILNTYDRFGVPAVTPVLLNLSLIGAAILGATWYQDSVRDKVMMLAIGVFVAGVVQLAFQLPYLWRLGLLSWPRWAWHSPGVSRIRTLMIPALFGSSITQINLLIDLMIASTLVTGSISWLYYSDRLIEFPLGVFGIALATVILPNLSRRYAEADPEAFSRMLDWSVRWVLLIGMPAALGLFLLAEPMLITLFKYGQTGDHDTRMASLSLMSYSFGLLGFILVKVMAPGFYARQDTRTPVRIGIIAMVSNIVLNLAFVVPMVIWDLPGPHAGLALATSVAAFINGGGLMLTLHRQGVFHFEPGWGRFALRLLLANGAMIALLLWGVPGREWWLQSGVWTRIGQLGLWVGLAMAIYALALLLTGVRPRDLIMAPSGKGPKT